MDEQYLQVELMILIIFLNFDLNKSKCVNKSNYVRIFVSKLFDDTSEIFKI